jgi:L-threonylcarbamoyladenylate synthase
LEGWVDHEALDTIPEPAPGDRPVTWVAPAGHRANRLLTGGRRTVAVRISRHPVASALARNADSAIVSTSANRSGREPARTMLSMRRWFAVDLDLIVPGPLGALQGPTEIRIAGSGNTIRRSE